jgi:four helix bundle protein
MATAQHFEDLGVWQDARALSKLIYSVTKKREFYRDIDLRRQIRAAAVSTMSNIAEGFERGTRKEFVHFLNIAKGSNGEVRSQLYVALDQEYVTETRFAELKSAAVSLSRRIAKFVRYLESCPSNTRTRKPAKR